jgi:3-oxoacyl-[acyl-carrier protein] reductase
MSELGQKSVVVSGGSSGIGKRLVERFAEAGAHVTFSYFVDDVSASDIAERTGAHAVRVDLSSSADVDALFQAAAERFGGVDVVVNNAAVESRSIPFADITPDDFEFVMGGNVRGGFAVLQNAVRNVRDGGRIVNISTLDTAHASSGSALYAASKAAVEHFVATIAKEVGARAITANSVSPGAIDTPRLHAVRSELELAGAVGATPLGRLGAPDDIADLVLFLVSDQGGWITGQNIRATGGLG